jgi:hypothetical protein
MSELGAVQRRVRGYWFVDGFQEIAGGFGLSIAGALFLAAALTSNETVATVALFGMALYAVGAFLAIRAGKRRITYARTGWVRRPRAIMLAKAAALLTWIAIAIPLMAAYERGGQVDVPLLLAATGAAIGVGSAWQAWRTGMRRFYVQAVLVAATGVAAGLGGLGFRAGFSAILLVCGLSLLASGAYALSVYLSKNPFPRFDEARS